MDETDFIPRVHLLSDHVANQIAAGEVIERPASVVKELIENSFDAGAKKIDIVLERGGTRLIQVMDDGHGIHPDDLSLALSSHGTSKIKGIEDLFHSNSLGFRGEALPSIASVSNFELISCVDKNSNGRSVKTNELNQLEFSPAPHPLGTTVKVGSLFYQTPARRKFLRSEKTEYLHVLENVKCMALSRFQCEITLHHNDKRVFHSKASEHEIDYRIAQVMGPGFIKQSVYIKENKADFYLWGRVGLASVSRSQSNRQYFYLNGRMIRDRHISHAIRKAYDEKIQQGKFPSYVLFMNMELAKSDVNVHPSKYEVRFSNTREVHDFIYATVKDALEREVYEKETHELETSKSSKTITYEEISSQKPKNQGKQMVMEPSAVDSRLFDSIYGKIDNHYLLTGKDECLLICDLLAIKKLIFRFQLNNASRQCPLTHRPLLVPISIDVTESEANFLESCGDMLASFGLQLQMESPNCILVRTIPVQLEACDLRSLIKGLTVALDKPNKNYVSRCIDYFLEQMTDESIRALSNDQISGLINQLSDHGIDLTQTSYKGLWRKLSAREVARLVSS